MGDRDSVFDVNVIYVIRGQKLEHVINIVRGKDWSCHGSHPGHRRLSWFWRSEQSCRDDVRVNKLKSNQQMTLKGV